MTARTPVYMDGTSIRDMSAAQILAVQQRCVYLFGGSSRPVNLTYDASNSGTDIRRMLDTRDTAGTQASNSTRFSNNSPGAVNDVDYTWGHYLLPNFLSWNFFFYRFCFHILWKF